MTEPQLALIKFALMLGAAILAWLWVIDWVPE